MKNIFILGCSILLITSCKDKSVEIKVDETKVEVSPDKLTKSDSVVISSNDEKKVEIPQINNASPVLEENVVKKSAAAKAVYASFGEKINDLKAISKEEMLKKYASMKTGDTSLVKFKSQISSVCKKKGCWMKMDLPNEKESFVRFKDYGFFVPLNADNSDAVVSGRAYLDVISVDELKHFAKDGGKSDEEISKITEPKITYAFQADGVLIQR